MYSIKFLEHSLKALSSGWGPDYHHAVHFCQKASHEIRIEVAQRTSCVGWPGEVFLGHLEVYSSYPLPTFIHPCPLISTPAHYIHPSPLLFTPVHLYSPLPTFIFPCPLIFTPAYFYLPLPTFIFPCPLISTPANFYSPLFYLPVIAQSFLLSISCPYDTSLFRAV